MYLLVIYLNRNIIDNPDLLMAVFTEELGHHLDNELGGNDAAGDEGEGEGDIFAQTLLKGTLSPEKIQQLRREKVIQQGLVLSHQALTITEA